MLFALVVAESRLRSLCFQVLQTWDGPDLEMVMRAGQAVVLPSVLVLNASDGLRCSLLMGLQCYQCSQNFYYRSLVCSINNSPRL